jgi:CheY-like chemotaxis protein
MTETLKGLRILIVEDESLVAMLLETILEDMGCETVGPISNVAEAVRLIEAGEPLNGALLDVNIAGLEVFPAAMALEVRGVPFIFSTGYGEGGLPQRWKGRITLQKPFTEEAVEAALIRALKG